MATVTEFGGSPQCRQIREYANGRQQTVEYTIQGDGNPETVAEMFDLPKQGDVHPRNPALRVVERTIERMSDTTCRAVILYSREGYQQGELEQTEIEWHMAGQEETIMVDLDGEQLYGPEGTEGIDVYRPRSVMSVTVYKAFFDRKAVHSLVGKVNRDTFHGERGGTDGMGRFLFLGAAPARKVGNEKWQCRYEFLYNPAGHQYAMPLYLTVQIPTGERDPDTDEPLYRTERQLQLDGDGNPILEIRKIYETGNFNLLGLGL